ncbi:hypothetical protein ACEQ8H_001496 [Pleosporales sp. CAS-2024a]
MGTQQYSAELNVALAAVHAASLLTKTVLRSLHNQVAAETKADDSPVTIADFAAQALLISALHAVYPDDGFIGEESADALRLNDALADRVWQLVLRAKEDAHAAHHGSSGVQQQQQQQALVVFPASKEDMLDHIDRGGKGEVTGQGRVWVMDPIDGTATFMQGQQYAVALCLLVDGVEHVGVVGCPNLAFLDMDAAAGAAGAAGAVREDDVDTAGYGVVLSAVKGHGTHVRAMKQDSLGQGRLVDLAALPTKPLAALTFVEAPLGKTSLAQDEHKAVADLLGSPSWPGTLLWSQQIKYVALTLGATDVMLRIPKTKARYTHIWDHAGGHILFHEAGGIIRDFDGQPIDFARGRRITGDVNHGMIAAMPDVFDRLREAVNEVLKRRRHR